ncbi:helix-turn-helix domain-containing protein [Pseudoteredinibacter isoporae]|uniref:AraC-like DNA-binding protein n=1 Tax=Pseudoteredinibacter isoporae TaxID=570281 RepID=A0A7X0JT37_9GAMM|nr:AraC family transcriptional regulator [Pseudoteredinibacter isoporae]MBB6520886.1 AraC-like DNA-binding protein [Pseudoteredinibacter isoporae]NHO86451.1 AraC family transcriptional regulator [Pseudoteredinibacter isoporae]NIB25097.1 AraC family transcriptional regulator [Pseudoteredinibacter isoporae]
MDKYAKPLKKPNVDRFIDAFFQLGLDPEPCLKKLGLSFSELSTLELKYSDYLEFLNVSAEFYQRRFLAIELAALMDDRDFGVLNYMLRSASNLAMLIELLKKYLALISPAAEIQLLDDKECFVLTYSHPGIPPEISYQDTEGTVVQLITIFQNVLDDEHWLPKKVFFQHKALSDDDADRFPCGGQVQFEQSVSGIYFEKSLMERRVESADPRLLEILEASALEALEAYSHNSLLSALKTVITAAVPRQELDVNSVAKELGMSRRTLSRRLKNLGTSFTEVKESILMQLACKSLSHSSTSISLIAQTLGYSDASAFNRAFRRVNHCSPREYRSQNR